mmetsp:Transcript_46976/g.102171  ORF Transcript_46976/g.102171 Transcript_46976/m.102171 type:complete len:417 (-) Transcript_46976:50-1300(-)|eukprot:CAMPEP_0204387678 /NCGR_PEP_ID=MMETSP0469-20131031/59083_1 /ASSEMBLY_ACC=CAM_ASM_000384 /TAXON_ID=2969 /ORGANISM="Oxyrrhis marina" /LENGTH=416 /DNA_ID=CAMNT_0051381079 /DNA_START=48 /DNA_END=1298 /DNA_ORIENTATION=+
MRVAVFVAAAVAARQSNGGEALHEIQAKFSEIEAVIRAEGHVTPGVYTTVKRLHAMVEQVVEPAIVSAHKADQMLVDATFGAVTSCQKSWSQYVSRELEEAKDSTQQMMQMWEKMGGGYGVAQGKIGLYQKCENTRNRYAQENSTVCCQMRAICPVGPGQPCEYVPIQDAHVTCDFQQHKASDCFGEAKGLISDMKGYFEARDQKYEMLRRECTHFDQLLRAQRQKCEELRADAEEAVDQANKLGVEVNTSVAILWAGTSGQCSRYKKCLVDSKKRYKEVVGPCDEVSGPAAGGGAYYGDDSGVSCVKKREQQRFDEWEAMQLIKCMLSHYTEGGTFDDRLMQKCKDSIGVCHLTIRYHSAPPPPQTCPLPDLPAVPFRSVPEHREESVVQPCVTSPTKPPVCVAEPNCPAWCSLH